MTEIWRDIAGYDSYQVSNFGRVRKLYKHRPPRILKQNLNPYGYLIVHLCRDNKDKKHRVHRLVAEAFIPNPDGKPQVNHIDGVKTNNHVDNLEWVTDTENKRHALATGLRRQGEDRPDAKLTNEQARYIRENPDKLTGAELAEMFGVTATTIGYVQLGKSYRNAGGMIRAEKLLHPYRLPDDIRAEIRRLYKPYSREFSSIALAKRFNCSSRTIRDIVNEK